MSYAGDLCLLHQQIACANRELFGNDLQCFTRLALLRSAPTIAGAQRGEAGA